MDGGQQIIGREQHPVDDILDRREVPGVPPMAHLEDGETLIDQSVDAWDRQGVADADNGRDAEDGREEGVRVVGTENEGF